MATTDKIRTDIEKSKVKIGSQQKRLRELEQKIVEEENLEIVRMVKAVKLDNKGADCFFESLWLVQSTQIALSAKPI